MRLSPTRLSGLVAIVASVALTACGTPYSPRTTSLARTGTVTTTATTPPATPSTAPTARDYGEQSSWVAEPGGYGRLRVGADLKAMKAAGIAAKSLAPCTGFSLPPAFAAHGVAVTENHGLVTNVWYSGPNPDNAKVTLVSTAEGIHVGSSLSELRAAYGRDLVDAPIDMEGGPMRTNVLFRPDGALVFLIDEHEKVAAMVSTTGSNLDDLVVATGGGC